MEKELYRTPSAKLIELRPINALLQDSTRTEKLDIEDFEW